MKDDGCGGGLALMFGVGKSGLGSPYCGARVGGSGLV